MNDDTLNLLLEDARKKLVETGTRNRLIHVKRDNQRANALNITNERSDDIFQILGSQGKRMRFLATGKDRKPSDNHDVPLLEMIVDKDAPFDKARYTDNQLETPLGPDALQKRLLRLARDSRTAEEEQGVNILFLALGFLSWFEDKNSDVKREAPLILLPVELVRNLRTSTFDVRCREDDIVTNLPLQERLKRDFGLDLPEIDAEDEFWTPTKYFNLIDDMIETRENWEIDRDGMQLGFFSFAKLLMLRDLDPEAWGDGSLQASPLIEGLLRSGFEHDPPIFKEDDRLDEILEPRDIIQVVDADASQTKVIEEVRSGRNLIVQGPPGTGKSQTITNIIASAVHDGRSVLFVAEKMAALSIVHDRLKKVGLDTVCLELHSRSANKKRFIGELARTLAAGGAVPDLPPQPDQLKHHRDKLNEIDKLLHQVIPGTKGTPFEAMAIMSQLSGQNVSPPKLQNDSLAYLGKEELAYALSAIDDYGEVQAQVGVKDQHPFFGVRNLNLQPPDQQRLGEKLGVAIDRLTALSSVLQDVGSSLNMECDTLHDCDRILEALKLVGEAPEGTASYLRIVASASAHPRFKTSMEIAQEWQSARASATEYLDAAWQTPTPNLRSAVSVGVNSLVTRMGGRYRSASRELGTILKNPLPKSAEARLELIDQLATLQEKRQRFLSESSFLRDTLSEFWREDDTPFEQMAAVLEWYERLVSIDPKINLEELDRLLASPDTSDEISGSLRANRVAARVGEVTATLDLSTLDAYDSEALVEAKLSAVINRLELIRQNQARYAEWCKSQRLADQVVRLGLGSLVSRMDTGEITVEAAKSELKFAYAEALWRQTVQSRPKVVELADADRHKIVEGFTDTERERITEVQTLIKARHLSQLPSGAIGEMGIIRGEIAKKRGHKPIRKMFDLAGPILQRIKPVLLMSPISVAQFVPPNSVYFDMLVIDEASQVQPADALGVIARARQIVVVGDQKQLPPTSFFDRLTSDESDEDEEELLGGAARATEMESILTLCEARSLPSRMLEWHYRSRDPSLIAVSNAEFYNHNLVLPPSPLEHDASYGLRFIRVPGAYTTKTKGEGKPGTNKIEAQEIVEAVVKHASAHDELSLGIVTFSAHQRNMVTELLELERRKNSKLDEFLREGKPEDVFVKNIENVQGDERDVILISVGYGPPEPNGRLHSMNFGPVNSDGGERRLNVLFSRSRMRCDVYASFEPGDIDLSRTTKDGPRILKRFIQFAKTGHMEQSMPTGGLPDSPFEEDVAEVIRGLGFEVDHQVGSAGFLIDLGVKNPEHTGQYMIAVECDGATYHSALWARERDRLRQEILEGLGWKFHRIWSTDWFYRRENEIERLRDALLRATSTSASEIRVPGANSGHAGVSNDASDANPDDVTIIETIPEASFEADPYETVNIAVDSTMEPHEAPRSSIREIVTKIVDGEGPIHQEEVARRLASAFGKERAGRRILETTLTALLGVEGKAASSGSGGTIKSSGDFWFTDVQERNPRVRKRSDQTPTLQKAEMIPPMEIRAAIASVLGQSGSAEPDEIVRAVARTFGFERVGPNLKNVIDKVILEVF